MTALHIARVVLYKHGVGFFEREATVDGDTTVSLTFKQTEVSDVLKSLTVLDLSGGRISSVSYDSTKPLDQLLAEVALSIPDQGSVVSLLPQLKGARVMLHSGVSDPVEGALLGIDATERQTGDGIVRITLVSLVTDDGEVRSFDLHNLAGVQILDPALRRDLDFYLRTQLSAKKKDARTFTFFAQGEGERRIRLSYTLEAPVWKATYRILLGEQDQPPMIQGWAVVDNTLDEDWEDVELSLISGLPVSFVHDLYTPRYIHRPEVRVAETTGVLPPEVQDAMPAAAAEEADFDAMVADESKMRKAHASRRSMATRSAVSSTKPQTRERKIGDLFAYDIEHPVTIQRNQSALVPIVLRAFEGRPVLLHNPQTRKENPMRCVEFKNTTGLTLEGGPVTVLEGANYVGEAMLETMKPHEERLVPYAVELGVFVLDNINTKKGEVSRVVIRNGSLQAFRAYIARTTYTFNNKTDDDQVVYLEHPRSGGNAELVDTPEPHEITKGYWRFRFPLPGRQTTQFVVTTQTAQRFDYSLSDLGDQQLGLWVRENFIDEKTAAVLRQLIDLRAEVSKHERVIKALTEERTAIHAEQKRIRENLQSLGDRPSEKELRERLVGLLNTQEDRLEEIRQQLAQQTAARDQGQAKVNETLGNLEYEVKAT